VIVVSKLFVTFHSNPTHNSGVPPRQKRNPPHVVENIIDNVTNNIGDLGRSGGALQDGKLSYEVGDRGGDSVQSSGNRGDSRDNSESASQAGL
jgi:hypothetical protein